MREIKKDNKKFIERTMKALEQYNNFLPQGEQNYGRTLFINACIGLLIVPRSSYYDKIPCDDICKWGLSKDHILIGENKKTKTIVRHLRNSIAHNNFHFDCEDEYLESVPIKEIIFIDINQYSTKETFRATFTYDEFSKFVMNISKHILTK